MKTVLETNLQGYDTVVALTQNNINANLKYLTGAKDGILPEVTLKIDAEDATLKAVMAPPTVKLNVPNQNHTVVFIVSLRKGYFEFWVGHGPASKKKRVSIDNWTIGFRVDLDFENIDRRNLPQEVQNEVYNLGGEMFSIRQLFMDFQNANLANWDTSSTTVPPSAQVVDLDNNGNPIPGTTQVVNISTDPSSNSYFVLYMNEYMKQTQQNGHHILGYTIAVNNPNNVQPLAPTFLPTDFTFSTNLFLPQGNPHEQDLQPGLDTLNFNVMTNHRAFPSNVGPWGGNFVTSEDVFGTMAISRRVFIDEYLLPTLAKITNFSLDIQKIGERSVSFNRNTSNHPFTVTKDGGTFSSSSTITLPSSEGPIGTFPSDLTFSSKTSSVIHISPGTNVINVTGYAEYNYEAKVWAGIKYHALEEIASQKAWVNWHLTITMDSVTGGGMNVVVKKDIPDAGNSNDGNWLGKLENLLNSDFSNYGISLRNTLLSSVNEDSIASDLTTIFNGMNRFVFPGGQTFKIVNPVFNNNLDLITNLKYLFY